MKVPPPPEVGDVFEGPRIGHGKPVLSQKKGLYYVRAIVDLKPEEDPEYGWTYQVVFRFYTQHKGWQYKIEDGFGIGFGRYKKVNKRKPGKKTVDKKKESEPLYIVRLFDMFDGWVDISGPVPKSEADRIWNESTANGTKKTTYADGDYYKVFPASTRMLMTPEFLGRNGKDFVAEVSQILEEAITSEDT